MSKPKITIVTACYNAEKTIEQTIQSVLTQTYQHLEYIIIDGASTDHTMEIVNRYRDRIDLVISEPDRGIYDAFNKGVRLASGEYINFMNADDYFSNESIVEQVGDFLEQNPETVMTYGKVQAMDDENGHWYFRGRPLTLQEYRNGDMYPHQSGFTQKKLFEEFGYFDTHYKILADKDFTIKCVKKYEEFIKFLPLEIAVFRLGGISSTLENEREQDLEHAHIQLNHFGSIPDKLIDAIKHADSHLTQKSYMLWLNQLLMGKDRIITNLIENNIRKVYIFGTMDNATRLYHYFAGKDTEFLGFVDNNPQMQVKTLHGQKIWSPDDLEKDSDIAVVISIENPNTVRIVEQQLIALGLSEANIFEWKKLLF